jgi:hypothetical protein
MAGAVGATWAGWPTLGALIAIVTLIVVVPVNMLAAQRRKQDFEQRYGSLDAFRAGLDQDGFRTLRETEGQVAAIRALRRDHPDLTLSQSVEIVQGL